MLGLSIVTGVLFILSIIFLVRKIIKGEFIVAGKLFDGYFFTCASLFFFCVYSFLIYVIGGVEGQELTEKHLKEKYPEIIKIIDKVDYENKLEELKIQSSNLSKEKEKIENEYQRLLNSKENNNEND